MAHPERMINTKAHALVDYLLGLILIFNFLIFGYKAEGGPFIVSFTAGVFLIFLALFTRFEYSLKNIVPLKVHLYLDLTTGIVLASSPWCLSFADTVYKPHLVFGLAMVIVAILTDRILFDEIK